MIVVVMVGVIIMGGRRGGGRGDGGEGGCGGGRSGREIRYQGICPSLDEDCEEGVCVPVAVPMIAVSGAANRSSWRCWIC